MARISTDGSSSARPRRDAVRRPLTAAAVAVLGMALAFGGTWPAPHASVGGAPRLLALHLPGGLLGLLVLAGAALGLTLLFSLAPIRVATVSANTTAKAPITRLELA